MAVIGTGVVDNREPTPTEVGVGEAIQRAGGDAKRALPIIKDMTGGAGRIRELLPPGATLPQRKAVADQLKEMIDREFKIS
ncbi:hypothetical protein HGA91_03205 [candidate division WWE3 bacterium]|nr:hypothetical protein [candidate division WWE3 bacterium]